MEKGATALSGRGLWWRPGFKRFKRFRGFRGEGIAFGDEYIISVTGLAFVSPVLHDEEQEGASGLY